MSFLLCMKDFKTIFENFIIRYPTIFLTPLAQKFEFSGLWCTTLIICKHKNVLSGCPKQYGKKGLALKCLTCEMLPVEMQKVLCYYCVKSMSNSIFYGKDLFVASISVS